MRPTFTVGPGAEELAFVQEVLNCLQDGGLDVVKLEVSKAGLSSHLTKQ